MTPTQTAHNVRGPRGTLTMEPISFSSGVPTRYRILSLPEGQRAEIALKRVWPVDVWKIRFDQTGRFRGNYRSEEDAFTAVQASTKT